MTLFLPEMYYLAASFIFFLLALAKDKWTRSRTIALFLSGFGIIVCVLTLNHQGKLFFGTYKVDFFSQIFKCLLAIGFFLIIFLGRELKGVNRRYTAAFYLFLSLSLLGLILLVSSVELITLFVALELSSYALYIVIPFRKDNGWEKESAMKYILFGAVVSGIMLFGMGYLLLILKTTYLPDLIPNLATSFHHYLAIAGFCLLLAAFFFKLTLFPFHFWSPDVYQGASNETTPFIATLPKVTAVVLLLRF